MRIPIRRGEASDAPSCAAIVNAWIDTTDWIPRVHSKDAIEDMLRTGIPAREFWVASDPIAGYLSFNRDISQVMGLYSAVPGSGVGRALMDHVKEGRDWIQLWSHAANTAAHRFYRREGFIEVEQNPKGADGIPEIRMEWARG